MGVVENERVMLLREALAQSGWVERTRDFARALRRVPEPGRLLLVGTPQDEPWHLAAHLDDEARYSGLVQLAPTLVRWSPPPGAPPHLSVTMARLEATTRNETVFVVSPQAAPETLLERVADARRVGATVLAIDAGDDELAALAHDRIAVPTTPHQRLLLPDMSFADMTSAIDFDTVSHLVSVAAGENVTSTTMRQRMARLIERMSGPSPRS